jgi:hypothetical protein
MGKLTLDIVIGAACAAFAGPSHAVTLNPRGLGQVLIYPYYTVNKDQVTLLSVVNTSDVGKVVGVHAREGYDGRQVALFYVFLSAHDVWTGAVTQTEADGGAQLATDDSSCTFPAIPATGVPFDSSLYDGYVLPSDGGPTSITRTREGMIELFAIADITPNSALDIATSHVQNGTPDGGVPPCTQSVIFMYSSAMAEDTVAPTSGLAGNIAIVNVGQGTFFGYVADALVGFTQIALFSNYAEGESLRMANDTDTAFPGGATAHVLTNEGKPLTLDYQNGIDAVSAVFAADAIQNEYLIDPNLGAETDWVVTFPTKGYYVDPRYVGVNSDGTDPVLPPFTESFGFNVTGQSNSAFVATVYDREEGHANDAPADIGPSITHPNAFSYQVNVLGFSTTDAATSSVLGSSLVAHWNFAKFGNAGWASLDLASGDGGHLFPPDHNGIVLRGLPVTGFMVYNIINAQAQPGMLANYGGVFPHRSTISCNGQAAPAGAAVCP